MRKFLIFVVRSYERISYSLNIGLPMELAKQILIDNDFFYGYESLVGS